MLIFHVTRAKQTLRSSNFNSNITVVASQTWHYEKPLLRLTIEKTVSAFSDQTFC